MPIQPYLFFEGRCEEALELYSRVAGAKVEMLMRYKDNPETPPPGMMPPGSGNKIMHCAFRIAGSLIMASDGNCAGTPSFGGFSLSMPAHDKTEAELLFKGLGEGGNVQMPLEETFFSPCFGIVADRFGVSWMVIVEPQDRVA